MSSSASSSSVVAVVLSKATGGGGGGTAAASGVVNVVLWASTTTTSAASDAGGTKKPSLTYYHYQDDTHLFPHTNAVLQRLAPTSCVHLASTLLGSNKKKKSDPTGGAATTADPALERLHAILQDSINSNNAVFEEQDHDYYDEDPTAAAPETIITIADASSLKAGTSDRTRLHSVIEQLLETNTAFLQFEGDVRMQQNPEIATALTFYLQHALHQYPTVTDTNSVSSIQQCHISSCLSLDRTAATAIHLWPPANQAQQVVTGGSLQTNSIYGLLSANCICSIGKKLLAQWLRQPLVDLQQIQKRQDAVELLVNESVGRDAIRQSGLRLFASIDLNKLAATLSKYGSEANTDNADADNETGGGGTTIKNTRKALAALYDLYLVSSQKIPLLTEQVQMALPAQEEEPVAQEQGSDAAAGGGLLHTLLANLQQVQGELQKSVELVEAVLDLEQAPREFLVQADYKDELRDILQELEGCTAELDDCHAAFNESWAATTNHAQAVRLEKDESSGGGWQFRLANTNDSKILQQQFANVKVHKILKNGVYFSTKELRQLSCKQQDLRAEYDRHQRQVVLDALQVAATYSAVLVRAAAAVSQLDVLTALAHTAVYSENGYCRPVMTDSDDDGAGIELTAARHPCVELQGDVDFIPNDCNLVFGESSFLLVTGPNMGGKSTYIRALGAIVTLAQIGSFVPCSAAKINICHHILARVGAGDLQERGISTFMAEMLESSSILRTATKRSLIIIDELGRGTSTFDGYGLARAISEYIVQKIGCMTVFATHFHELTVLEEQEKAVKNCHVTAQKGSQGLTFLYEVKPGPCLESFGIQVAEMANVPHAVIQDAKRRARELENFEYRKKAQTTQNPDHDPIEDHASAEEASAALAQVNRFRRLSKDAFMKEYPSGAEKRDAFMKLFEA